MNYRLVYMKIINNARYQVNLGNRPRTKYCKGAIGNYEYHHVLPKSLFPRWKKRKSNIVPLTPREHLFCHQLLTKIYPGIQMQYALLRLCGDKRHTISSRLYERERNEYAKLRSSKYSEHFNEFKGEIKLDCNNCISNFEKSIIKVDRVRDKPYWERPTKGVRTLEQRKRYSEAIRKHPRKPHPQTDNTKKLISEATTGRHNYWTGDNNKLLKGIKIYCFELNEFFISIRSLENRLIILGEVFNRKHFSKILKDSNGANFEYRGKHYVRVNNEL